MSIRKEKALISLLLEQGTWITASDIGEKLKLSCRSINNYVSQINCRYDGIVLSSNKGYSIQRERAIEVLNALPDIQIPGNYEERKKYVLEKLLLSHQLLTVETLIQRFCISRQTLQNEISRLRSELGEYKLSLSIKNDSLSISGSDRKKQELIMALINDELEDFSFNLDKLQSLFVNVDLKDIRNCILDTLKNYNYFLDDYSLLNYIIHIAVLLELEGGQRSQEDDQKSNVLSLADMVTPHVNKIIKEIYHDLSILYRLEIESEKFVELSLPIMTNAVSTRITRLQVSQLADLVGKDIEDLLFEIIDEVRTTYFIDLKEDNFLIRFAYHLKNVIIRAKNDVSIGNSQFLKIKNEFPLIYVIAVFISNIIKNKIGKPISKDEIAYIALHIGAIMEEKKAYTEKLRCIVLAPGFNTVNRTLFKRLKSSFVESLIITNFIASTDELPEKKNFDLLLSTADIDPVDIDPELGPYFLHIDQFLSEASIKKIYQKIDEIKQLNIKRNFLVKLKFFFREDLFFYDSPFATQTDAIEAMCDQMVQKGYVDEKYKEKIYEHEALASSAYGNIAIPHPLSNYAGSSVIAVSINPEPIDWSGRKTNLVFMLSLEEENRYLFKEIFQFIIHIISSTDSYSEIMKASTYQDFLDILVSYAIS